MLLHSCCTLACLTRGVRCGPSVLAQLIWCVCSEVAIATTESARGALDLFMATTPSISSTSVTRADTQALSGPCRFQHNPCKCNETSAALSADGNVSSATLGKIARKGPGSTGLPKSFS
jgi:hypothetical protein